MKKGFAMTLIPFDDRDGFIWIDGHMMPWRQAQVHVMTHGLHYASSVFEGERAYNGVIFRSNDHSKRLIRSAEILGMTVPYTADELDTIKYEVLKKNNLSTAYLRPVAWRGSEEMGIGAPLTKTHIAIACWDWPSYYGQDDVGIKLCSTTWRKPDPRTMPTASKTAGLYCVGTIAKHEAGLKGCQDVMMLDTNGDVAEATSANLFAVIDGVLKTPEPKCFLNGLTRQTVLDLARTLNITASVERITPDDMKRATEVFLTGTAAEVVAVGKIEDQIYKVGDITKRIRTAYGDLVRSGREYTRAA
jgi:branched-chain amino acid aminotransferase